MLCMTNRYNHCTDRVRQLILKRDHNGAQNEPDLDKEIQLVFRRASNLRKAMLCLALSAVCSSLLVATNVASHLSGTNLILISAIWLISGLILIVACTAFFSYEVSLSLRALNLAVEHLPNRKRPRQLHFDE